MTSRSPVHCSKSPARWACLTVFLYALCLVVLTAPVLILAFGDWWGRKDSGGLKVSEVLEIYRQWGYWLWLGILVLGQALLLLVPVDAAQRRLIPRRKLMVPVITGAFLFTNIVLGTAFSLAVAIFGDNTFEVFEIFGKSNAAGWSGSIIVIVLLWTLWAVVFFRATRSANPADASVRIIRWLLKGSILELLVAVPSHIIVRHREVCCAPIGSLWGITTGISVMLLCYGPGVFFLFADRFARKRPPIDSTTVGN